MSHIKKKISKKGKEPTPGDLPDSGIKPTSPALAGRFFITEPPARP